MKTVLILNTVGLLILFIICTLLFIMLIRAYKHIKTLENIKADSEERIKYHENALKTRANITDPVGFDFNENRCVVCGNVIPEDTHVCVNCKKKYSSKKES